MSTQTKTTLMGKKKAELVDIILRKDDVEIGLRKELSDVKLDFEKAKDMCNKKDSNISELKKIIELDIVEEEGLKSSIDDLTSDITEIKERYNRTKGWNVGLLIVIALLTAALFVF